MGRGVNSEEDEPRGYGEEDTTRGIRRGGDPQGNADSVVLLASWPAQRAARVDPVHVLNTD